MLPIGGFDQLPQFQSHKVPKGDCFARGRGCTHSEQKAQSRVAPGRWRPVLLEHRMSSIDLAKINAELGKDAQGLVDWAVGLGRPTIVTTNFRPFEAVILHMVTR